MNNDLQTIPQKLDWVRQQIGLPKTGKANLKTKETRALVAYLNPSYEQHELISNAVLMSEGIPGWISQHAHNETPSVINCEKIVNLVKAKIRHKKSRDQCLDPDFIIEKMLEPAYQYQTWSIGLKEAAFWKATITTGSDNPLLCIAIDLINHYKSKSKNIENT